MTSRVESCKFDCFTRDGDVPEPIGDTLPTLMQNVRERVMDILEMVAIEIPCRTCGGRYEVSLKKIALSQQMLHDGCPVRAETECPPLFLSGFVDRELTQDLQRIWSRLEKEARGVNGEVKLHSV